MVIGIGVDIAQICRLASNLEALANRVLTRREKLEYESLPEKRKAEWLAGRFAAKEAFYKAFSTVKKISVTEIEVLTEKCGAPTISVEGYHIFVSISHDGENAVAMVVIEK